MPRTSAGIALFRRVGASIEILLVHPGGPFWAKKDEGAWSFPKGEFTDGEDPLACAIRELEEETGCRAEGNPVPLGEVKQKGGKVVHVWAIEGDCDVTAIRSNSFTMEWPPRSGLRAQFPEIDRAGWFSPDDARDKLLESQRPFLDRLLALTQE